jgi:hypothetical protein
MKTLNRKDDRLEGSAEEDPQAGSLVRQLVMAHEINRRARMLLHADTQSDAPIEILENLRNITGMDALSLFKRHADESGGQTFERCCQTRKGPTRRIDLGLFNPDNAVCERLAAKKPVRMTWPKTADAGRRDSLAKDGHSGLIIPINVFGAWWGGLCLDCGSTKVDEDTPVFESFVTTADFLGVFFERQMVSREHTESDKLAGALEMAGTVCHKLNQPMQVILGYASMVTSGDIREPDQVCDIVKMIEDETRRMGIITKNLMGITKYRTVETPEVGSMCDVDSPTALR